MLRIKDGVKEERKCKQLAETTSSRIAGRRKRTLVAQREEQKRTSPSQDDEISVLG